MPTPIAPIITNAGLAAAIAADGAGLDLAITHVQFGTSAYTLNTADGSPDYDRVALVAPKELHAISAGYVLPSAMMRIDVFAPAWTGSPNPYSVTEVGFWAGNPNAGGVLFALWAQATAFAQRNMLDYLATFKLQLVRVPYGSVTVVIDANLSHAAQLVAAHEAAANPHPQYLIPRHRQLYLGQQ
ncbi:MAG: hypothetical protein LCH79_16165 [Proteobacteria bacterium]|nr:hypothetical protein [Pseudomonadota bacterium]